MTASHTNSPLADRSGTRAPGRIFSALTLSFTAAATVAGAVLLPAGPAQAETAPPATPAVAHSLTLTVGGHSRAVTSYAATVSELLTAERVSVGRSDLLSPAPSTSLDSVDTVRVVRVVATVRKGTKLVRQRTVVRRSPSLAKGHRVVAALGHAGRYTRTVQRIYHDGRLVSTRVVGRSHVSAAPRVVLLGTASWPVDNRLHWAALAQCESGGNPRIVSASGQFYGLYQFTIGTWAGVGGHGLPSQASAAEQTYRAQLLYNARGRSPWPVCGQYL